MAVPVFKVKRSEVSSRVPTLLEGELAINLVDKKIFAGDSSNQTVEISRYGVSITDDVSTDATRYLTFTSATTGSVTVENISSTKLTFNPASGSLGVGGTVTASGFTVSGQYSLPTTDGSADQVLTTDGSGNVTFANAPVPTGTATESYVDAAIADILSVDAQFAAVISGVSSGLTTVSGVSDVITTAGEIKFTDRIMTPAEGFVNMTISGVTYKLPYYSTTNTTIVASGVTFSTQLMTEPLGLVNVTVNGVELKVPFYR